METAALRDELRFIARLVSDDLGVFFIGVGGSALYAAGAVGSTIIFGRLVDNVILPTFNGQSEISMRTVLGWSFAVLLVAVARIVGVVTRRFFAGMTSERIARRQRTRLAERYVRLPMAFHRRRTPGDLLAHVDSDTDVLVEVIHPLPFSFASVFIALLAGGAMLVVDPVLALLAVAVFPAIGFFNRIYSRRIAEPARLQQESMGQLSSIAHESFDGALLVKLLGQEQRELDRFSAEATALRGHRTRVGYLKAVFEASLDAMPAIGVVLVMVVGAWRVDNGHVTVGGLLQIAALFAILSLPMRVLGYFLEKVPPGMAAQRRLNSVFAEPLPTPGDHLPPNVEPGAPLLEIENLTIGWDDQPVLSGVSLSVDPGETVALVGATGSGKSTLIEALTNELDPHAGSIRLNGVPLDELDPAVRADTLRFAFQEAFLFADSIAANVGLDRAGVDRVSIEDSLSTAQATSFVAELQEGTDTVVGQRGLTLSGGQRQRVALARALVGDPSMIVIDDAFSAVDPAIERQILDALRDRAAKPALLIVAHRLSTIRLADRVVFIKGGRVVAEGAHDELMTNPDYFALATAYEQQDQAL